jgi:hypothetical protein
MGACRSNHHVFSSVDGVLRPSRDLAFPVCFSITAYTAIMEITLVPTPPSDDELTVYQVLDDLGKLGLVWREIDKASANEQAIIDDILSGHYERPLRVVAFNTDEGWSRDVTNEIVIKLLDSAAQGRWLTAPAWEFVERRTAAAITAS